MEVRGVEGRKGFGWWREELRKRALAAELDVKRALKGLAEEEDAQGTTEYAILVGVLVVIAILSIVTFRDKVSELWDSIANGINSL